MVAAALKEPAAGYALNGDDEPLYEEVNGQRVELPPMGVFQTQVASDLLHFLQSHVRPKKLGTAVMEALFELKKLKKKRRPDVAFVNKDRWPFGVPSPNTESWNVVPNLAVEVVSPTNTAEEVRNKMKEYFQAGVQLVWVIYPVNGEVEVHDGTKVTTTLSRSDTLDGGKVLPKFRLPLAKLFPAAIKTPADSTK